MKIDVKLDDSDYKKFLGIFPIVMPENMRIAMLKSLDHVALTSVSKYMSQRGAGVNRGSKLHIVSGRLVRSLLGKTQEGVRKVYSVGTSLVGMLGSNVPYARIHEKGGVTPPHVITPKRASVLAFWSTGRSGGGSLIFAKKVNHPGSNIPARPYLEPALKDSGAWIYANFKRHAELSIRKAE